MELSRKQRLVLICVAGGMTIPQVAISLGIKIQTARGYIKDIRRKWDMPTQELIQLVIEGERRGILQ